MRAADQFLRGSTRARGLTEARLSFKNTRQAISSGKRAPATKALTSMSRPLKTHDLDRYQGQEITTHGERMKAPNWTEFVLDARPIEAIFGANPPSLASVDLHEINLHRDGPRVLLRFDLREFPAKPPSKWSNSGFNRVQMNLLAGGVHRIEIAGFSSSQMVDLSMAKDGPLIHLRGQSEEVSLVLVAESVSIERISAYRGSFNS